MKYTRDEFLKLTAEVIEDLMQPDEEGDRLPAPAFMLALFAAKITTKLFDGEEIEIIMED